MGKNCTALSVLLGVLFASIGVFALLFGFVAGTMSNSKYTEAECYVAKGVVFRRECQSDCWNCFIDCWDAFTALTAVQNISMYTLAGTYLNEKTAEFIASESVGMRRGVCYYKRGGYDIILNLADTTSPLIASIVFFVLAGVIFLLWAVVLCYENVSITIRLKNDETRRLKGNIQNSK